MQASFTVCLSHPAVRPCSVVCQRLKNRCATLTSSTFTENLASLRSLVSATSKASFCFFFFFLLFAAIQQRAAFSRVCVVIILSLLWKIPHPTCLPLYTSVTVWRANLFASPLHCRAEATQNLLWDSLYKRIQSCFAHYLSQFSADNSMQECSVDSELVTSLAKTVSSPVFWLDTQVRSSKNFIFGGGLNVHLNWHCDMRFFEKKQTKDEKKKNPARCTAKETRALVSIEVALHHVINAYDVIHA